MTPAKLKTLAPAFDAEDDATLITWIELAEERLNACAWGRVYGTAVCYLAAHLLSIAKASEGVGAAGSIGAETTGAVQSVTVGRWSVGFGGGLTGAEAGLDPASDGSLVTTRYGQQFLALRRTRGAGGPRFIWPE